MFSILLIIFKHDYLKQSLLFALMLPNLSQYLSDKIKMFACQIFYSYSCYISAI